MLVVARGDTPTPVPAGAWHTLSLTTTPARATGVFDGTALFRDHAIRDLDTGFAAFGTNLWAPVQFGNFSVAAAPSPRWAPPSGSVVRPGATVGVAPCTSNGLASGLQTFVLDADWALRYAASGLCVEAAVMAAGATLTLQPCAAATEPRQQFRNDYTHIRNGPTPVSLGPYLLVASNATGATVGKLPPLHGGWATWT